MVALAVGQSYTMVNGSPIKIVRTWADPERDGDDPEAWFVGEYQLAPHLPVNTTLFYPDGRHWTENPEFPYAINFAANNDGWTT